MLLLLWPVKFDVQGVLVVLLDAAEEDGGTGYVDSLSVTVMTVVDVDLLVTTVVISPEVVVEAEEESEEEVRTVEGRVPVVTTVPGVVEGPVGGGG